MCGVRKIQKIDHVTPPCIFSEQFTMCRLIPLIHQQDKFQVPLFTNSGSRRVLPKLRTLITCPWSYLLLGRQIAITVHLPTIFEVQPLPSPNNREWNCCGKITVGSRIFFRAIISLIFVQTPTYLACVWSNHYYCTIFTTFFVFVDAICWARMKVSIKCCIFSFKNFVGTFTNEEILFQPITSCSKNLCPHGGISWRKNKK